MLVLGAQALRNKAEQQIDSAAKLRNVFPQLAPIAQMDRAAVS